MRVDNSDDSTRAYDIMAKIQCTPAGVTGVFDGVVSAGGSTVGTFNNYGAELSVTFLAAGENGAILSAVTQFINNVKSKEYDI